MFFTAARSANSSSEMISSEGVPSQRVKAWLNMSAKTPIEHVADKKAAKAEAKQKKKQEDAARLAALTERLRSTDSKRDKVARTRKEDVAMYGGMMF